MIPSFLRPLPLQRQTFVRAVRAPRNISSNPCSCPLLDHYPIPKTDLYAVAIPVACAIQVCQILEAFAVELRCNLATAQACVAVAGWVAVGYIQPNPDSYRD